MCVLRPTRYSETHVYEPGNWILTPKSCDEFHHLIFDKTVPICSSHASL